MKGLHLLPHERSVLALARSGTLPHPRSRTEADIRALQVLLGLGLITVEQANASSDPQRPKHGIYRDGDLITGVNIREFRKRAPAGWAIEARNGQRIVRYTGP